MEAILMSYSDAHIRAIENGGPERLSVRKFAELLNGEPAEKSIEPWRKPTERLLFKEHNL